MTETFTFAHLVRTLGRGSKGSRSLTREEARFAMTEIWAGRETPAQLGALLMLMRVKEETPDELAGLLDAARTEQPHWNGGARRIDWPAYAGKRRQPSWYVLAARALARAGYPVLMHGGGEHTAGRQYARQVCEALGIPVAKDWEQAQALSLTEPMVYCALEHFAPKLSHIIDMKAELGLRSPVNTLVRHLNPTGAPVTLQGMFHRPYQAIHHETARGLGDARNAVLKGDSGEFEVRPDSDQTVLMLSPVHAESIEWTRVLPKRSIRPPEPDLQSLLDTWSGQEQPEYGLAAIWETMALVLTLSDDLSQEEARERARQIWQAR
ncbi:glycosyl transferase family protein [Saccharospirillum mangrovi]|uniref:glycosyl transferase family protein n=1 Tax=Saccharospirillum mangrovi TaxID=2161747 RepID=UPI000D347775|nr:glycosyl transferase family protein [Saccharospirillum mangrovi]